MKRILLLVFMLTASLAVGQTKTRQATLSQQKMCAEQARRMFDEKKLDDKYDKDFIRTAKYVDHYDATPPRCYVVVDEFVLNTSEEKPKRVEWISAYDAFEGNEVAVFAQSNDDEPQCYVTPRGQDSLKCYSRREFRRLIYKHFGIEL